MSKRPSTHSLEKEEAKKRRLEVEIDEEEKSVVENIRHPDELSWLENLTRCDHVLENIIGYLPKKDILTLTLTNKTLNKFISENGKVLQRFDMVIPKIDAINKKDYNFLQIRHYPNWQLKHRINSKNFDYVMNFFQRYGPHMKSLTINTFLHANEENFKGNCMTNISLMKILSSCPNLQQLDICIASYGILNSETAPPHLPKLTNLMIGYEFCTLLPLFKNYKLRAVGFHMETAMFFLPADDFQIMKDFFKGQNELENLKFRFFPDQLWDDDHEMSMVGFRLKSFTCEMDFGFRMYDYENYAKFFNLHKHSLVHVEVDSHLLKFFEGFNCIKSLSVNLCSNNMNGIWPSVEKLKISRSCGDLILESLFPNMKEFEAQNMTIFDDFLSTLPKIEVAKLTTCRVVRKVSLANMKVLYMDAVTINADVNFTWKRNLLKEIVVHGGDTASFIKQLLMRDDTNLDRLQLVGWKYMKAHDPTLHQVIGQNRHKIQILIIAENKSD